MSFPTIGKTIFPTFHAFMYIAHIFINISYLFDCIFYFSILNCFDVLGALLSVWFFNTIESGRSMICPKTSIYIYWWKYSVGKNKIYRRTLHIVQFI